MIARLAAIGRNSLRPGYFRVMAHKVLLRWQDRENRRQVAAVTAWCAEQAEDAGAWGRAVDAELWAEAEAFAAAHDAYARPRLTELPTNMGGGGNYVLLYFLTRHLKPANILETGVAAGHTSRCFLSALKANGSGRLLSSDFPLFRMDDPERHIGHLVEPELREGWTLLTKGDRENIPALLEKAEGPIGLFHYDSDKSTAGRVFAMSCVQPRLAPDAVVVFDDIQDSWHFRDLMKSHPGEARIFEFQGKYVGMLLPPHGPGGN